MNSTTRMSTRPSRKCRIAPVSDARLLTRMLVPPAMGAAMPISSIAGSRIVPSARPTKPPSSPTPNDTTVSSATCHTSMSEGSPNSLSGKSMARILPYPRCRRMNAAGLNPSDRVR